MFILLFLAIVSIQLHAQQTEQSIIQGMKYRHIGPFRGGRSLACTGVPGDRQTYYFGATGGGIWKTEDAGESWYSISDTLFMASSIGAIAIAPSDPSMIYVGTGECDIRGNISFGEGIYRTLDAGKTWKSISPKTFGSIAKISIHPNNAEEVLIASMGRIFGPNPERGVYKTTNGGTSWTLVLKRSGTLSDSTGAIDIQRDPHNPRIMYAALWQASRNAHSMNSGGQGSGLFQ
ncbi:MAG: WD40/YVTN/BNR-like repeat-containing protein, partial [Candidatus Kapaibacteriota bacterium]